MKRSRHIKLKAVLLLVVFSLQTIIGFACSVGLDMGYNSKHHGSREGLEPVVHIHKDGSKHLHYEKKKSHDHSKSHHHDKKEQTKPGSGEDNCCSDQVKKLEQVDKSLPSGLKITYPLFVTAFLAVFYKIDLYQPVGLVKDIKRFVRCYHPPIPDIRIAIRSFQI